MSTLLFSLHLSRHIKGFGKPSVKAAVAGIVGHYVDGVPHKPAYDDVRNALPHYYRAAFDRARGSWSVDKHRSDAPCSIALYGSRGRYLNTVYAVPYMFTSTAEER